MEKFWSKTKRNEVTGCLEWTSFGKQGKWSYGFFRVTRDKPQVLAHRYAWILTYGKIPENMCVLHVCDNPRCVEVKHLRLGTHQENMADRDAKGRCAKGERQHLAKFTAELVREIRSATENGEELAKRFDVSRSTINRIRSRRTWKHIA